MHVGRVRKRLNIESTISPINEPLSSVYGKPIENTMDALLKKKKMDVAKKFGNNIEAPDYMMLSNLNLNKLSVDYKNEFPCNRKHIQLYQNRDIFNISPSMSQSIKSLHTYPYNPNTETTNFIFSNFVSVDTSKLNSSSSNSLMKNINRKPRDYDIISTNQNDNTKIYTSNGRYFSQVAALNIFIKSNDSMKIQKRNTRISDGIYEYLQKNNYIY